MFPAVRNPGRLKQPLAILKRPNYLPGRFETFLGFETGPGQFKTWFQNGQINNLAVLKPHLISKFFYSMCSYMYKMYFIVMWIP